MIKQLLIAIDQLLNCFVYIPGDGFGKADETLSARFYRLRDKSFIAFVGMILTDCFFFWEDDHCKVSYEREMNRKHLPAEYRNNGFSDIKK